MARMEPLRREDVPELEEYFEGIEGRMGFLPRSVLTMARKPDVVKAFLGLAKAVYQATDGVPLSLRNLIANVASRAAGCQYCVAHTASNARQPGSDIEGLKLASVWEFQTSPLFDDRERAALSFAAAAAAVPNMVDDSHFEEMRKHFTETEIIEIMSLVSYFGFLNRWNDSMATELEPKPIMVADEFMTASGWTVGKHSGK